MQLKKIICIIAALLMLLPLAVSAAETETGVEENSAENDKIIPHGYIIPQDENVTIRSKYALVYSEYDDRYLYAKNDDKLLEPASTVKIMVGVMMFEKFAGRFDTEITVTNKLLDGK